jgi:DNA-binding response OmpR family regulator
MKILLVENHQEFTAVVVPTFLSEHEVTTATSLSSARACLSSAAFDAVLVDYDLDDGKGDTLVRWLSARVGSPAVVGISSHEAGNDALTRAGAIAVCSKLQFDRIGVVLSQISDQGDRSTS